MPLILGTNSIKDTAYNVDNSLRFNDGSSDSLTKTFSTPTNNKKFTISMWVKRATIGGTHDLFHSGADGSNEFIVRLDNDDTFFIKQDQGGSEEMNYRTNRLFRDLSAWYHIVVAIDTTNATAGNRQRIYINGVEETSFSTSTNFDQNDDVEANKSASHSIGKRNFSATGFFDGYMAEVVFIDGQQLDPTSFGEFDEDSPTIWKPKDVSGLTFGTNGFHLDFEDSSALGNDVSGNNNDFTVNNLTSVDQSTDTCTNNFATINSLENYHTPHTLSEGNLKQTTASSSNYAPNISTIALTQGKWYFECKYVSRSNSDNYNLIGVKSTQVTNTNYLGQNQHDYGYYSQSGKYYTNNSAVTYGDSYDQGDIIGVYLDLDNNKLYFAKNGTLQNSGTGISITDPASTPLGHYFFAVGDYGSSLVIVNDWNFGGTQSFSISSGNTDPNGYGNFEYDPSSGTFDGGSKSFYALNTKNLAEFG